MEKFIEYYQYLPYKVDPIAISIGNFTINWYSIMYAVGFSVAYLLLARRIRKKEFNFNFFSLFDFLSYIFIGLILGARLGYVLFYDLSFYLKNPTSIISPFDPTSGAFIGIFGMSYHGGLVGAILAGLLFSKIKKIKPLDLADFIAPAIPAGYFFGRIGNFINGELFGRATEKSWGMFYPSLSSEQSLPSFHLRHPSQLYEAFFEGIVLFIILWSIKDKNWAKDKLFAFYLIGYAMARIIVEFFREPDRQIGYLFGFFTLGQLLSSLMIVSGILLIFYSQKLKKMLDYKETK